MFALGAKADVRNQVSLLCSDLDDRQFLCEIALRRYLSEFRKSFVGWLEIQCFVFQ